MRFGRNNRLSGRFTVFLSSNTQDFIEVVRIVGDADFIRVRFLSSNTQDFIEVRSGLHHPDRIRRIPEL